MIARAAMALLAAAPVVLLAALMAAMWWPDPTIDDRPAKPPEEVKVLTP